MRNENRMKNNDMGSSVLPKTRDQSGFTLIEVLISMTLLAVGILGLAKSADTVTDYQNRSNEMTEATLLTSNRLEEIRRLGTNEVVGGIFGFDYIIDTTAGGFLENYTGTATAMVSPAQPFGNYSRSDTINVFPAFAGDPADFDNPALIDMVQAVVTTTWNDRKGRARSVQLAAVIHRRTF